MIVLNPFLDSLCNLGLKNIGLTPGIPKGCFQRPQDIVIYSPQGFYKVPGFQIVPTTYTQNKNKIDFAPWSHEIILGLWRSRSGFYNHNISQKYKIKKRTWMPYTVIHFILIQVWTLKAHKKMVIIHTKIQFSKYLFYFLSILILPWWRDH